MFGENFILFAAAFGLYVYWHMTKSKYKQCINELEYRFHQLSLRFRLQEEPNSEKYMDLANALRSAKYCIQRGENASLEEIEKVIPLILSMSSDKTLEEIQIYRGSPDWWSYHQAVMSIAGDLEKTAKKVNTKNKK